MLAAVAPARRGRKSAQGKALRSRESHIRSVRGESSTAAVRSGRSSWRASAAGSGRATATRDRRSTVTTPVGLRARLKEPRSALADNLASGKPSPADRVTCLLAWARRPGVAAIRFSSTSPKSKSRWCSGPPWFRRRTVTSTAFGAPETAASTPSATRPSASGRSFGREMCRPIVGSAFEWPYLKAFERMLSRMMPRRCGSKQRSEAVAQSPVVLARTTLRPSSKMLATFCLTKPSTSTSSNLGA
mmetsp:Transcript_22327/g.75517  ORF Transcript_22327/g.75517 Transcript_22327/m.75517 type:complete len:245 (-) Transcript_22327:608-1342(-)